MQLKFGKYEGAGNDFILIDTRGKDFVPQSKLIARVCDRHFGIGADGVMTLSEGQDSDCTMRYYNSDGTAGEMCGNGGRCFALFAYHLGIGSAAIRFDSLDGPHTARLLSADSCRGTIELGMIDVSEITEIRLSNAERGWSLNTGVPHFVLFTNDLDQLDVVGRGRPIRYDLEHFPHGTNVNFVQILRPGVLRVRTYERGVEAETLACGTGATAAALVANRTIQQHIHHFEVLVPGGQLGIAFENEGSVYRNIRLSGEARKVFTGEIETDNFSI